MNKFLHCFSEPNYPTKRVGADGVRAEFRTSHPLTDDEVVVADYTYEDYDGSAFVLFVRDGIAYEVNGGHCSCNGLEEQWEPETVTPEALLMRKPGAFPSQECYDAVRAWALANQKEKS